MVDLCTSPNETHSQGRRHQLESVLALGCISRARHAPGSNLLLNPGGAGDPALSPGDCCHPLMTRLPLDFLCSHPIPPKKVTAAGHKAEERQFPFPFFTSQRDPPELQPFQRAGRMQSQLEWSRQTHVLSCHHPVPLPAGKHAQNPPAQNCVDLGFPPGGLVQLLEAGSSKAFTWCGGGGGGGRQVQVLGFQRRIQAQRARSEQRSPPAPTSTQLARQELHVPASREPPAALQDGEQLPGAGSHPWFPCGRLGLLRECRFTAGRWQLGFCFGCTA